MIEIIFKLLWSIALFVAVVIFVTESVFVSLVGVMLYLILVSVSSMVKFSYSIQLFVLLLSFIGGVFVLLSFSFLALSHHTWKLSNERFFSMSNGWLSFIFFFFSALFSDYEIKSFELMGFHSHTLGASSSSAEPFFFVSVFLVMVLLCILFVIDSLVRVPSGSQLP